MTIQNLRKRLEELENLLGQCAKDWGEARDLGQQHLDRAEDAERERDKLQVELDLANFKRCTADPPCCERVESLQADLATEMEASKALAEMNRTLGADLDAALRYAETGIASANIKALLEKRRERG
jgi:acyl-homoserine lactone acylase PvdQ